MKRRQYLATLTVAGSFAVAGCGSNSSDGNGSSNTGPKGAVRTYFTALENADANARNEIVHADSPLQSQSFGRKRESIEYTINSLETVEQPVPANANNYDTVETFQAVKVTVTLAGEVDGETREEALDTTVVVAQNTNGNWKFWLPIGAMQSTTEDTGEEVTEQVTNRLVEENTVGMVDGNQVDAIEMTVRLAAGSSDVNLNDVTIQLVTANGSANLVSDQRSSPSTNVFSYSTLRDDDSSISSESTLNDRTDRAIVTIGLDGSSSGNGTYIDAPLEPGETATVGVSTQTGGETTVTLVVPDTLTGEAVSL